MILTHIKLVDFRGYERLDLDLGPKGNLILGPNASGKTNLAEAIHFLSLARSFRTSEDENLIRYGQEIAVIETDIQEGAMHRTLRIEIGKKGKRIFLNEKPLRRLSELSKAINVIVYAPGDAALFYGGPSERRAFLDIGLSKQSEDYFRLISRFNRILKERNIALKKRSDDKMLLDALTDQLIEVAEPIVRYRTMYVASLNEVLPRVIGALRGDQAKAKIVYRSFVKDDGNFRENAKRAYEESLEGDILKKSTSIGPQREDFTFRLNGKDISEFGSQGENRIAALALKLCPYFLIEEQGRKPICVLDDVTSELDANHRERLLLFLNELGQTFLTATDSTLHGDTVIDISAHRSNRRN